MTRACSLVLSLSSSLVLLLFVASCARLCDTGTGQDAVRAAAERAAVEAGQQSSLTLVPYRAFKLLTRSKGAPNRPTAWEKLDAAIEATSTAASQADVATLPAAYGALAVALVKAKDELHGHDEDEFPFLWTTFVKNHPPPAKWYDNGTEHLALGTIWLALDIADGATTKKLPAHDVIFYESGRSTTGVTGGAWPREARAWSQLLRGMAYAQGEHHYAAEEELTAYLAAIEREPANEPLVLAKLTLPPADTQKVLRAAGHFARAWNRMGLGRNETAAEDIKLALVDLEGLGIDNELTQWGWAFVHHQQQNYAESAKQLEKLALSPHLDEATRAEIKASAAALSANSNAPVLGRARGGVIIGKALLSRAGGLDHILDVAVGSDAATQAKKPLEWLRTSREQLAQAIDPKAKLDAVKRAIDPR